MILASRKNKKPVETEREKVILLNSRLQEVRSLLIDISKKCKQALEEFLDASEKTENPMYDYEIEARLSYCFNESDPEYDEDSDNILTSREEYLKHPEYLIEKFLEDWTVLGKTFFIYLHELGYYMIFMITVMAQESRN